ncbi:MAG: hypothetical protein ACSHXB_19315 [Sulfitobacter sp.]
MKNIVNLDDPDVSLDVAINAADQIARRLNALASTIGSSDETFQFYSRTRVKTRASIEEKAVRKRKSENRGANYSFHEMTDLVGLRIVTLYEFQLPQAQKFILSLVSAGQTLPQPLFVGKSLETVLREAKYYAQDDHDEYQTCYNNLLGELPQEDAGMATIEIASEHLYSSGHLIFDAVSHQDDYCLRVPVEFQIRTAVEDIWAEVNHKLLYKIRDHYVWSNNFETYYDRAGRRSKDLKKATEDLAKSVRSFSESSESARDTLENFNSVTLDDRAENSFGVSLMLRAASNQLDPRISNSLASYSKPLREFAGCEKGSAKGLKIYNDCLLAINSVIAQVSELEAEEKNNLGGVPPGTMPDTIVKIETLSQLGHVSKLERLRLRSSAILEDICIKDESFYRISDILDFAMSSSKTKKSKTKGLRKAECRALYKEFCEFLDTSTVKVKPLAVIYLWKHMLSSVFDAELSRSNIIKSYRYLQDDRTVQDHSVYKVVIPRALASHHLFQARDLVQQFASDQSKMHPKIDIRSEMPSLQVSLTAKVNEALKLALEAAEATVHRDNTRGDFRLGLQSDENAADKKLMVDCIRLAKNDLGVDLPRKNTILATRISGILPNFADL